MNTTQIDAIIDYVEKQARYLAYFASAEHGTAALEKMALQAFDAEKHLRVSLEDQP